MFDDLTGAPFYCLPDMMCIKNDYTGANSCCMFYTDDNKHNECVANAWVKGWIARDVETTCEREDDEEDENSFDPRHAGFKILLEYFMMTPEEQVKRHSDYAQLIASLVSGHMK